MSLNSTTINYLAQAFGLFLGALIVCLIVRPRRGFWRNAIAALVLSIVLFIIIVEVRIVWSGSNDKNLAVRFVAFFVEGAVVTLPLAVILRVLRALFFRGDSDVQYSQSSVQNAAAAGTGCAVTYNRLGRMVGIGNLPVEYDRMGRIALIGDMPVTYGTFGRITQIGSIVLNYNALGQITAAGEMPVSSGPLGRVIQVGDQPIEYTMLGQIKFVGGLDAQYNRLGRLVGLVSRTEEANYTLTRRQIVALVILFRQIAVTEEQNRANQQMMERQRQQRRNNSGW